MSEEIVRRDLSLPESLVPAVLGLKDAHLKMVREALHVDVAVRGGELVISGVPEAVDVSERLFLQLAEIARHNTLSPDDVRYALKMLKVNAASDAAEVLTDSITVSGRLRRVTPKSPSQQAYVQAIRQNDMVFGVGPAGTGKTYLAMAMAVHYYLNKRVNRIILTRPAVEAGEKLGFLPGDLADKINPYLRPLYDALYSMMDFEHVARLMEKNIIEVAPLAFMRGRTLNDCFVILDEAQNTTPEQMKMFLTRLGFSSKAVITGDVTQVDLPTEKKSGLVEAMRILKNVEGISISMFGEADVVRHPLVQRIICAYDVYEGAKK